MPRQTLEQWAALQPTILSWGAREGSRRIADRPDLVDRPGAWNLADYRVSSVSGGVIWFMPRARRGTK